MTIRLRNALFLLLMAATPGIPNRDDDVPDWKSILTKSQDVRWPAPRAEVTWLSSLEEGLALARQEQRPLFVTLRCLPCKQCAVFDKDVLEGGPALDPLLRQFVTVRLTDAALIDWRLLPVEGFQDLDLSWWGYFLSPEARLYGIFGGRDDVSDATRISIPALQSTLRRVLAHHYHPERASWDIDGPAAPLTGRPRTVRHQPGWRDWARSAPEQEACVHCHQVAEVLREPAIRAGTFDKSRDLDIWPLPENVGLSIDRDHGLQVTQVETGSAAERAGLRVGDELAAASGRRLFGQADLRGVLHRGPRGAGEVSVQWLRNGKLHSGDLALESGWRATVLDWRMSISQGNIGVSPGFFPLPARGRRAPRGLEPGRLAIEPYHPRGPAAEAGLRGSDVVIAVNGESPDLTGRAFLVWFRRRFDVGDTIRLTVRDREGNDRTVEYVGLRY